MVGQDQLSFSHREDVINLQYYVIRLPLVHIMVLLMQTLYLVAHLSVFFPQTLLHFKILPKKQILTALNSYYYLL